MKTCPPNFEFRVSSFEFPSALWTFHIYINIYPIYNIYMESCSKDGLPQNDFGRLGEEDWGRKEGGRGAKK